MKSSNIIHGLIQEIPREERWLFDLKNKAIVEELKQALKQKAHKSIDLNSLLSSLDEE